MNTPKLSIIVPVYNASAYIEKCARSLFEQTFTDIEYIFVNDCTPDNSIQVLIQTLEDYPERKSQVVIINNDHNLGAAGAKNAGMKAATGEYMMFADSDDWLDKDGVEKMYEFAKRNDLDIAYSNFCGGYGRGINDVGVEPNCEDYLEGLRLFLTSKLQGIMPNKIIRRDFFRSCNEWLIEGANVLEDLGFCIRLFAYKPKVAYVPVAFYHYYIENTNSVLRSKKKIQKENPDVLVNMTAAIRTVEAKGLDDSLKEELLCAKAKARDSLLGTSRKRLQRWRNTFPESDSITLSTTKIKSVKIAKWFLLHGIYFPMQLLQLITK